MSTAPPGTEVGLFMDMGTQLEAGDYLRSRSGRTYLVDNVRVQQRGVHIGRQHLRCIVVRPEDVAPDARIIDFWWYPRGKK